MQRPIVRHIHIYGDGDGPEKKSALLHQSHVSPGPTIGGVPYIKRLVLRNRAYSVLHNNFWTPDSFTGKWKQQCQGSLHTDNLSEGHQSLMACPNPRG